MTVSMGMAPMNGPMGQSMLVNTSWMKEQVKCHQVSIV